MPLKKLRGYFIAGLVILAPIFLTLLVLVYLVRLADTFVVNPLFRLLPFDIDLQSRILLAKVVIALAVIAFVIFLGMMTREFMVRRLLEFGESVLERIPLLNRVYRSLKDISRAMFGNKSGIFQRVVFIQYPSAGLYVLGFVTSESFPPISEKLGGEFVNVFVPSPPNPTTGYSMLVPRANLIDSGMTVEEGIKYSVSYGAALPALPRA